MCIYVNTLCLMFYVHLHNTGNVYIAICGDQVSCFISFWYFETSGVLVSQVFGPSAIQVTGKCVYFNMSFQNFLVTCISEPHPSQMQPSLGVGNQSPNKYLQSLKNFKNCLSGPYLRVQGHPLNTICLPVEAVVMSLCIFVWCYFQWCACSVNELLCGFLMCLKCYYMVVYEYGFYTTCIVTASSHWLCSVVNSVWSTCH